MPAKKNIRALTLVELLVSTAIIGILVLLGLPMAWAAYEKGTEAVSVNALRQLSSAGNLYLGEHNNIYWKYSEPVAEGMQYWFGLDRDGTSVVEGQRTLDMTCGPLGQYIAQVGGLRMDLSFLEAGSSFKPKYKNTQLAFGYNTLLDGTFSHPARPLVRANMLKNCTKLVVFATSAQINTFQAPATPKHPMLEEFYMINDTEYTVHFRHNGKALAAFADGSVGFLSLDPKNQDTRLPAANIGKLSTTYVTPVTQ
ncbi:MAG: prepilin-type N-terminal cleavage/methylation domain-containing protein [Chthoniobacterales bacterium]